MKKNPQRSASCTQAIPTNTQRMGHPRSVLHITNCTDQQWEQTTRKDASQKKAAYAIPTSKQVHRTIFRLARQQTEAVLQLERRTQRFRTSIQKQSYWSRQQGVRRLVQQSESWRRDKTKRQHKQRYMTCGSHRSEGSETQQTTKQCTKTATRSTRLFSPSWTTLLNSR